MENNCHSPCICRTSFLKCKSEHNNMSFKIFIDIYQIKFRWQKTSLNSSLFAGYQLSLISWVQGELLSAVKQCTQFKGFHENQIKTIFTKICTHDNDRINDILHWFPKYMNCSTCNEFKEIMNGFWLSINKDNSWIPLFFSHKSI